MGSYIGRRLLYCIPVLLLVSIMAFSLLHLSGGDPAAMMLGEGAAPAVIAGVRSELGLDKPLYEQYWSWCTNSTGAGSAGPPPATWGAPSSRRACASATRLPS